MFAKMEDVELVLRFFALRHAENFRGGMQGFLDLYMRKALGFNDADIAVLEKEFNDTLALVAGVYGDVVSNNSLGAELLTRKILELMPDVADPARAKPYFIGGLASDYASLRRIEAFGSTVLELVGELSDEQFITCGYAPGSAAREVAALCDRLGGLPAGLFVNSIRAFEGVVSHFVHLPPDAFAHSVIGCYDYDPFAAFLQFPVHMVRQNSNKLISTAFDLIDQGIKEPVLIQIEPELIPPRTIYNGPFTELG